VQPTNYLGIYIAKDHATAVMLTVQGRERTLAGCFTVPIEQTGSAPGPERNAPHAAEPSDLQTLSGYIAAACAQRQFKADEVAVALDCAMFMQHSVHSEFADVKKITQTVRFDAEEALGTDASDVAIAFKIDSSDQNGSNLSVFTAPKQLLGDLLSSLQANAFDPVSIEPDVNCLARFICHNVSLPPDARPLFGFLSRRNGYFITPVSSPWLAVSPMTPAVMRTFLLGAAQNRTELLARQLSMTTALLAASMSVNSLELFDSADSVRYTDIAGKLTTQTNRIDIFSALKLSAESISDLSDKSDGPDVVELAIACGAAVGFLDPPAGANWRSDFMPYEGKKQQLQNALKLVSIAALLLVLALGVLGLMHVLQVKKYRDELRSKFAKDYSAFMFGQPMPGKSSEAVRRLGTSLRRIKDAQNKSLSLSGEEAVAGKLTLVLQAFNKCASATGLNIGTVNITDKSVSITGDTSSPENTLKLFEALKQSNLNVLRQTMGSENGRGSFNVTVEPKKTKGSE
jgi:type II secretory pathway component PulL